VKAIVVMYDSLNRRSLPPYGAEGVHAPNFERLAQRAATFDNCYAGSMPCMPARREMHTGRYNFLHRGWGPLEPFDDSMPELLRGNGVYTHLVTDHQHYWEDGGATYHNRYSSYELFRGQEGDRWKGQVADPPIPDDLKRVRRLNYRHDWVNRQYLETEDRHPQTQTFDAGVEFIRVNAAADRWMVQIETFDPHEPFFSYKRWHDFYPEDYAGPHFDWPDYKQVLETRAEAEHARNRYHALLSMCDYSLGRVLDLMDELDLWRDTMLMVVTDHGFLLGEHGWWGKGTPPWYDETIHTPLFVWDPREPASGARRDGLVQTIDFAPTLLDFFGVPIPDDMRGIPLRGDAEAREAGLFGAFGGHVSVTDGRYVYMRAPARHTNTPLFEHTLMPTHMNRRFDPQELRDAELVAPFSFTKGVPVLRAPGVSLTNAHAFGTLLYDLASDPNQERPIVDDETELRMVGLLVELMRANDAPPSQFERLGLPGTGPVGAEHLQVGRQWAQVEQGLTHIRPADYPYGTVSVHTALSELLADPRAAAVLAERAPGLTREPMRSVSGHLTVVEIASFAIGVVPEPTLRLIADDLARCSA
jgi:arylsulfatase A-like enzyme